MLNFEVIFRNTLMLRNKSMFQSAGGGLRFYCRRRQLYPLGAADQSKLPVHEPRSLNKNANNEAVTRSKPKSTELDKPKVKVSALIDYLTDYRFKFSSFLQDAAPEAKTWQFRRKLARLLQKIELQRSLKLQTSLIHQKMSIETGNCMITDGEQVKQEHVQDISDKNFPLLFPKCASVVISDSSNDISSINYLNIPEIDIKEVMAKRVELFDQNILRRKSIYLPIKPDQKFKSDLKQYKNSVPSEVRKRKSNVKKLYYDEGADKSSDKKFVSNTGCQSCGALLHSLDPSLPGFLASQAWASEDSPDVSRCEKCTTLSATNTTLQVYVDSHSHVVRKMRQKGRHALLVVVVDLMDMPCSLHPELLQVIAPEQPVILVGNKMDLVPLDHKHTLHHVRTQLLSSARRHSLAGAKIVDTLLVSASTGWGVQNLVSALHFHWRGKGDIFLLGSCRVGKSTLFSALQQSPLCQRGHYGSEEWEDTGRSMLKFPLVGVDGRLAFEDSDRQYELELHAVQHYGKNTVNPMPYLLGQEPYVPSTLNEGGSVELHGAGWCYDTPSILQNDQCLELLTHEELQKTLPCHTLNPRTYRLPPGYSLFLAGLARLDLDLLQYTEPSTVGRRHWGCVLVTVFSSMSLPVTIVETAEAECVYRDYLGSEVLAVPSGGEARLRRFPELSSKSFEISGVEDGLAAADIVLSSFGWVSVSTAVHSKCTFVAWSPGGRGLYLRRPPFLPYTVTRRGPEISNFEYGPHIPYVPHLPRVDPATGEPVPYDHDKERLLTDPSIILK